MKPSTKHSISLPISLTGLFDASDDEDNGDEEGQAKVEGAKFENESEIISTTLGGYELKIRQMVWHQANANIIWPGTYNLVDHIFNVRDLENATKLRYETGKCLELGAATGALSLALMKTGKFDIITSDIDDEGIVEENIRWNYHHNGSEPPKHIPHTWGNGWSKENEGVYGFKFIIASDILLYVSVYPLLVQSLKEIFEHEPNVVEFLMSWNRRIQESSQFYDLMKDAGFQIYSHGKGLYSFYRLDRMDSYLQTLAELSSTTSNKSSSK